MAIRYRRNINCLTTEQLHDLREAISAIFQLPSTDPHSFELIAGLHGSPSPTYCRHGSPGFLTWHRAYLVAYETALMCQRPNVALPYWDWSSKATVGVPAACRNPTYVNRDGDTVPNPLYSGPKPAALGGGMTSRKPSIDSTSFASQATSAQSALGATTFSQFQSQINGPHGSVHVNVGGDMSAVSSAGFDPIFYLHHANVDRLWAQWQSTHPAALPATEASFELEPFNQPFSATWKTGAMMQNTEELGYRYSNICFIRPPLKWREWVQFELEPWVRDELSNAQLVLRSQKMAEQSMELKVFVAAADQHNGTFEEEHHAGTVGVFGMRGPNSNGKLEMPKRAPADIELQLDISQALRRASKSAGKLSMALLPVDLSGKPIDLSKDDFSEIEVHVA